LSNPQELRNQIIEKAWSDSAFKKQLLSDPKAAIKDAFGIEVPADINLQVLEETDKNYYLVLPSSPSNASVKGPMWI
jgi:TOMM propeptide domain